MPSNKKSSAVIASVGMIIVVMAITVFTAYRSVHFIQETLPAQSWLLAFFALGALDVGLVLWVCLKLWKATNTIEHAISLTMIAVDLLGMSVTFVADTVMQSGVNGLTGKLEGGWVLFAILFTSVIILSNVIAFVAYHLNGTEYQERVQEDQRRYTIIEQANRISDQRIKESAARLAPILAEHRATQMEAQFLAEINHMKQRTTPQLPGVKRSALPAPKPKAIPRQAAPRPVAYDTPVPTAKLRVEPNKPRYRKQEQPVIQQPQFDYVEDEQEVYEDESFLYQDEAQQEVQPSNQIPVRHNGVNL